MVRRWLMGEAMPQESNRITLKRDRFGLRVPNMHFNDHQNYLAMCEHPYAAGGSVYETTLRCDAHVPGPRHIPLVTTSIPLACARSRIIALAALVPKVSRSRQPPLVLEVFADAHAWSGLSKEVRIDVLQRLLPTLTTLPQRLITQIWIVLLTNSKARGRWEVLADIQGMAALLCSRFGPDVASLLDDAIALGTRPRWP